MTVSRVPEEQSTKPALSRFETLPVLTAYTTLIDGEHVIEGCNHQFRSRLGRPRSELVGQPLRAYYDSAGVPGQPAPDGDDRRGTQFDGGGSISAGERMSGPHPGGGPATDGTERWPSACTERDLIAADGHLVHTLAETVPRETTEGYAVIHVDITRRKHREKQVAALNRLLRHNVRNDLNLLRGYAQTLHDHDDPAIVAAGTVIDRIADRWLGLAETGREIDQLSATTSVRTVTLGDLFTSARRAVERDCVEGTVAVEFVDVGPERSVSEQWYPAVVELCENGITHASDADDGSSRASGGDPSGTAGNGSAETGTGRPETRPDPTESSAGSTASVQVTVRSGNEPGWVVIAVADGGPGIPSEERTILQGDSETPLRHGSGLGTWLVRFVADQFGGRVVVEDRDPGGSVVELHVPLSDG
jgi:signal transduction histidine kinase